MNIISTRAYEVSHGKKPSGWGYWQFEVKYNDGSTLIAMKVGTFTSAKKQLMKDLRSDRSRTASSVEVMP
jgi:hypothetical protein